MGNDTPKQKFSSTPTAASAAQAATQDQTTESAAQAASQSEMATLAVEHLSMAAITAARCYSGEAARTLVLNNQDLMSLVFENYTDEQLIAQRKVSNGFKHKIDQILLQRLRNILNGNSFNDVWNAADIHKKINIARLMIAANVKPEFNSEIRALHNIAFLYIQKRASSTDERCLVKALVPFVPINRKSMSGMSVLEIAVSNNHIDLVQALLKDGVDVNVVNSCGKSLLHMAVENGYEEIVKGLLSANVDVDAQVRSMNSGFLISVIYNNKRETALHIALEKGQINVIKLLLDYGARLDIKDITGETAQKIIDRRASPALKQIVAEALARRARAAQGQSINPTYDVINQVGLISLSSNSDQAETATPTTLIAAQAAVQPAATEAQLDKPNSNDSSKKRPHDQDNVNKQESDEKRPRLP